MKLPVYELRINEEAESYVEAIALVNQPAIESDFIAFSQDQKMTFTTNDEKRELIGCAMVPNMNIYRKDQDGSEYNVFFTAETIRQIAQVYFKRGFQKNLNLDHSTVPANSYIFQSYIVDSSKGMTSPAGLDLPDGSWVIGVKVEDEQVWKDIKEGKRNGFSVEGIFQFLKPQKHKSEEQELLDMIQVLNQVIQNKIKNKH